MLKSNVFGPGAIAPSNVVRTHLTAEFSNPSCFATAYATAASNPSPASGASFRTQGEYAGSPVAIVSVPGSSVLMPAGVQSVDAAVSVVSCPAQPARSRAAITNGVIFTSLFITCLSIVGLAQQ